MQIKMEKIGCFQASVSYGDINLKNGDFNILVLSSKYLTGSHDSTPFSLNVFLLQILEPVCMFSLRDSA